MRIGLGLSLGTAREIAGALRFVLMLDFKNGIYSSRGVSGGFGDVVTFNRASTGTYWAQDGTLQTTAADEPRFEYDPVTGEAMGLLVEGASANALLRSTDVSNAVWAGTLDFTPSPVTSVIAGQTAQRMANNGTVAARTIIQTVGSFDGGWRTVSVIWEADTATSFLLTLWDVTAGSHVYAVTFDTAAMTATPFAGTGLHKLTDLGIGPNGGRLVRAEVSGVGTTGNTARYSLYVTNNSLNTNAAIVHHTQSEALIGATSPIVTGASAVTRAADDAVFAGDVTAMGLDGPATVVAFGRNPRAFAADGAALMVGIGPFAERITIGARDFDLDGAYNPYYQHLVGTESDASGILPQTINPASVRLALAWDTTAISGAQDGAIVWTATKTATRINPIDRIDIGALAGGARKWGGTIERIVVYPTRLTDAQLQGITS